MDISEENAPTTVKEVGIHLTYMRRDLQDLKQLLEDQSATSVPRSEHDALEKRVSRLEGGVIWIIALVGVSVIGAVLKTIGLV